jgi:hypothetical protein
MQFRDCSERFLQISIYLLQTLGFEVSTEDGHAGDVATRVLPRSECLAQYVVRRSPPGAVPRQHSRS